jgi:hypothetical protein
MRFPIGRRGNIQARTSGRQRGGGRGGAETSFLRRFFASLLKTESAFAKTRSGETKGKFETKGTFLTGGG